MHIYKRMLVGLDFWYALKIIFVSLNPTGFLINKITLNIYCYLDDSDICIIFRLSVKEHRMPLQVLSDVTQQKL